MAESLPVIKPLQIRSGFAEEFKLHLFELSRTEDEVAGSDLVPEALTDLADAEGDLLTCGTLDIAEVNEDTLSCLRSQVYLARCILSYADECLKHEVELTDISEIMSAACRTWNVIVPDVLNHILRAHAFHGNILDPVLLVPVLNEIVSSVSCLTLLTVDKGIGESSDVT